VGGDSEGAEASPRRHAGDAAENGKEEDGKEEADEEGPEEEPGAIASPAASPTAGGSDAEEPAVATAAEERAEEKEEGAEEAKTVGAKPKAKLRPGERRPAEDEPMLIADDELQAQEEGAKEEAEKQPAEAGDEGQRQRRKRRRRTQAGMPAALGANAPSAAATDLAEEEEQAAVANAVANEDDAMVGVLAAVEAARANGGDDGPRPSRKFFHRLRRLIRGVYERHNPEKMAEVSDCIKQYAGAEMELYRKVCAKYGEEPEDISAISGRSRRRSSVADAVAQGQDQGEDGQAQHMPASGAKPKAKAAKAHGLEADDAEFERSPTVLAESPAPGDDLEDVAALALGSQAAAYVTASTVEIAPNAEASKAESGLAIDGHAGDNGHALLNVKAPKAPRERHRRRRSTAVLQDGAGAVQGDADASTAGGPCADQPRRRHRRRRHRQPEPAAEGEEDSVPGVAFGAAPKASARRRAAAADTEAAGRREDAPDADAVSIPEVATDVAAEEEPPVVEPGMEEEAPAAKGASAKVAEDADEVVSHAATELGEDDGGEVLVDVAEHGLCAVAAGPNHAVVEEAAEAREAEGTAPPDGSAAAPAGQEEGRRKRRRSGGHHRRKRRSGSGQERKRRRRGQRALQQGEEDVAVEAASAADAVADAPAEEATIGPEEAPDEEAPQEEDAVPGDAPAPEEEAPQDPFDGHWMGKDAPGKILAVIEGDTVLWTGGKVSKMVARSGSKFSIELGGKTYNCCWTGSQLVWDDGDIWVRMPAQKEADGGDPAPEGGVAPQPPFSGARPKARAAGKSRQSEQPVEEGGKAEDGDEADPPQPGAACDRSRPRHRHRRHRRREASTERSQRAADARPDGGVKEAGGEADKAAPLEDAGAAVSATSARLSGARVDEKVMTLSDVALDGIDEEIAALNEEEEADPEAPVPKPEEQPTEAAPEEGEARRGPSRSRAEEKDAARRPPPATSGEAVDNARKLRPAAGAEHTGGVRGARRSRPAAGTEPADGARGSRRVRRTASDEAAEGARGARRARAAAHAEQFGARGGTRRAPEPDAEEASSDRSSSSADGERDAGPVEIRRLISDVYRRRNPAKLREVDDLLRKYSGAELALYHRVCEKYGERPVDVPGYRVPTKAGVARNQRRGSDYRSESSRSSASGSVRHRRDRRREGRRRRRRREGRHRTDCRRDGRRLRDRYPERRGYTGRYASRRKRSCPQEVFVAPVSSESESGSEDESSESESSDVDLPTATPGCSTRPADAKRPCVRAGDHGTSEAARAVAGSAAAAAPVGSAPPGPAATGAAPVAAAPVADATPAAAALATRGFARKSSAPPPPAAAKQPATTPAAAPPPGPKPPPPVPQAADKPQPSGIVEGDEPANFWGPRQPAAVAAAPPPEKGLPPAVAGPAAGTLPVAAPAAAPAAPPPAKAAGKVGSTKPGAKAARPNTASGGTDGSGGWPFLGEEFSENSSSTDDSSDGEVAKAQPQAAAKTPARPGAPASGAAVVPFGAAVTAAAQPPPPESESESESESSSYSSSEHPGVAAGDKNQGAPSAQRTAAAAAAAAMRRAPPAPTNGAVAAAASEDDGEESDSEGSESESDTSPSLGAAATDGQRRPEQQPPQRVDKPPEAQAEECFWRPAGPPGPSVLAASARPGEREAAGAAEQGTAQGAAGAGAAVLP